MAKRLYIYESATVTDSWHSGGGLMIVTAEDPNVVWRASDMFPGEGEDLGEPDHVYDVADDDLDKIVIFPDAGCC